MYSLLHSTFPYRCSAFTQSSFHSSDRYFCFVVVVVVDFYFIFSFGVPSRPQKPSGLLGTGVLGGRCDLYNVGVGVTVCWCEVGVVVAETGEAVTGRNTSITTVHLIDLGSDVLLRFLLFLYPYLCYAELSDCPLFVCRI